MTLTTHAIVGAAAASFFPTNPALAFVAGFASHLVIDSIPHGDYQPKSFRQDKNKPLETDMVIGKDFWADLAFIAGDGLLGIALSLLFFSVWLFNVSPIIIVVGAFAGQFPDALQFVYFKTRSKILEPLQLFHIWIQQKSPIAVPAWVGVGLQCALIIFVLSLLSLL